MNKQTSTNYQKSKLTNASGFSFLYNIACRYLVCSVFVSTFFSRLVKSLTNEKKNNYTFLIVIRYYTCNTFLMIEVLLTNSILSTLFKIEI